MAVHLLVMNRTAGFLLVVMMIANVIETSAGRIKFPDVREVEIRNRLKQLNKPALKSIQSSDGDIIDCISITDQPAFDHPLLKNHTIQMRPSFYPRGTSARDEASSDSNGTETKIQIWHMSGECPENTVPIRRTTKEDLSRAYSIENYGKKSPKSYDPAATPSDGHEYAIALQNDIKVHGGSARINVWKPSVQENEEFSVSQIWVFSANARSTLEAGWQVSPSLYKDSEPRFFIYWTRDGYQETGCYNLQCPGFVQVSKAIAIGAAISPVSTIGGSQYEVHIYIFKDPKSGNWWLRFGGTDIGYWPNSLVPDLAESAAGVEWGGEVVNLQKNGQHTTTQMGNGHFPDDTKGSASYFSRIHVVDTSDVLRDPQRLQFRTTRPTCYNLKPGTSADWGTYFFYGGPGRNPNCP